MAHSCPMVPGDKKVSVWAHAPARHRLGWSRRPSRASPMKPYYEDDLVTLFHADWREVVDEVRDAAESPMTMVTDPPYGIDYRSGKDGTLARSIEGDMSTRARDEALAMFPGPALVFGSWRRQRPIGVRMVLVWDTGGALGMGDLSLPWKPSHQEVYVIGDGFSGRRTSDVLAYPPVQSSAWRGRVHPHEKPVPLMRDLVGKTSGTVFDPFAGSGPTLVAAKSLGRWAIGVEVDEAYCEIAASRCSQEVLGLTS